MTSVGVSGRIYIKCAYTPRRVFASARVFLCSNMFHSNGIRPFLSSTSIQDSGFFYLGFDEPQVFFDFVRGNLLRCSQRTLPLTAF